MLAQRSVLVACVALSIAATVTAVEPDWYITSSDARSLMDITASEAQAVGSCSPTPADVLGPYYQAQVPYKSATESFCEPAVGGLPAVEIKIKGTIYKAQNCSKAMNGKKLKAVMEVWQADNIGAYDNIKNSKDHNCRTKLKIGTKGTYSYVTIRPANYGSPGCLRPSHIHLRITAKGYKTLVTQMYFTDDQYLGANDCGCSSCGSANPSQQTTLNSKGVGVFNIYLQKQ